MRLIEDQPIFAEHHLTNLQNFFSSPNILNNGMFATLRHKRNGRVNGIDQAFSDSIVDQNWRYFLKRLNRMVLKSAHKNRKEKLQHISVEHKHVSNHWKNHIHTIIVKPATMTMTSFTTAVIDCWKKTPFGTTGHGNDMFAIRKVYSAGIIKYQFSDPIGYDSYTLGFHTH